MLKVYTPEQRDRARARWQADSALPPPDLLASRRLGGVGEVELYRCPRLGWYLTGEGVARLFRAGDVFGPDVPVAAVDDDDAVRRATAMVAGRLRELADSVEGES